MMLMADSACVCDPPESWICGPPESCICGPAEPPSSSLGVFVPVLLLVLVLVAVPVVLGTLFFVDMFKSFCCVERPTHVRRRRSRPFELGGPIANDASCPCRPRSPRRVCGVSYSLNGNTLTGRAAPQRGSPQKLLSLARQKQSYAFMNLMWDLHGPAAWLFERGVELHAPPVFGAVADIRGASPRLQMGQQNKKTSNRK
jgi:hypothetical protein